MLVQRGGSQPAPDSAKNQHHRQSATKHDLSNEEVLLFGRRRLRLSNNGWHLRTFAAVNLDLDNFTLAGINGAPVAPHAHVAAPDTTRSNQLAGRGCHKAAQVVLLVAGGDKRSQRKDIENVKRLWDLYKRGTET